MGIENSSLSIKINLPKQTFSPGEFINGTFNLDFNKNGKKINIRNNNVIISFPTAESTYHRMIPKERKSVLSAITLNFPQLLELNNNPKIEIPFQIQVPINAKPSFEWPRENNYASYRNFLKISIPEIKAEGTTFIIIKKLSTPLNTPLNLVECNKKKGLLSSDGFTLNVKYNTNSFPINSKIPFTFTADFSQSKFKIKSMEFVLKRKLKFIEDNKILEEEVIDELQQKNIKGNKTKIQTENFVADLMDPKEICKKYSMKKLSLVGGLNLNEVINFMPNIKASLFECEYYIKVKAITDTPLISGLNSPSMYVPLDVFQADNSNVNLNINQSVLYQQQPYMQNNQMQNPYMQNNQMQNNSIQNSYMQNPQMQNSYMQNNPNQQSYMQNSYMQNPYMQNPPIQQSYMQNPSMQQSYMPPNQQQTVQQSYMPPIQNSQIQNNQNQQSYIQPPIQNNSNQQPSIQQSYMPPIQNNPIQNNSIQQPPIQNPSIQQSYIPQNQQPQIQQSLETPKEQYDKPIQEQSNQTPSDKQFDKPQESENKELDIPTEEQVMDQQDNPEQSDEAAPAPIQEINNNNNVINYPTL